MFPSIKFVIEAYRTLDLQLVLLLPFFQTGVFLWIVPKLVGTSNISTCASYRCYVLESVEWIDASDSALPRVCSSIDYLRISGISFFCHLLLVLSKVYNETLGHSVYVGHILEWMFLEVFRYLSNLGYSFSSS